MSEKNPSIAMLQRYAAAYVYETFALTDEEAAQRAAGMIGLVEAKGGDVAGMSLEHLCGLLTKSLNEKYAWRSAAQKQKWLSRQEEGVNGYNAYLDKGRHSPFKKW